MRGLAQSKKQTLYANIIDDRVAPFYSTFVTDGDAYTSTDAISIDHLSGSEDVLLNPDELFTPIKTPLEKKRAFSLRADSKSVTRLLTRVPYYTLFAVLTPTSPNHVFRQRGS